jgi:hypothetical protein
MPTKTGSHRNFLVNHEGPTGNEAWAMKFSSASHHFAKLVPIICFFSAFSREHIRCSRIV